MRLTRLGETGPLEPYQRPKTIMLYLLIPAVAVTVLGYILLNGEFFTKRFKYDDQTSEEVAFDTTQTAATANELLLQFHEKLLEFDKKSRNIFRDPRHEWIVDGKRADTPEYVFRYVKETKDESFLKDYFELGVARAELETTLTTLEHEVDSTVISQDSNATKESVFRAERLVRKKIAIAKDDLDLNFTILNALAKKYEGNSDE